MIALLSNNVMVSVHHLVRELLEKGVATRNFDGLVQQNNFT